MVFIIKKRLDLGFDYVLLGKTMSGRLEAELGIYRGSSGGNYFITCEQVVNSLSLQRLKLYHKLDIQQSDDVERTCCLRDLESNDDDIELVDNCFIESSRLNENERSTLYHYPLPLLPKMLCLPPSFLRMFLMANFHILQESCSIFHCIATHFSKPGRRRKNVATKYSYKPTTLYTKVLIMNLKM